MRHAIARLRLMETGAGRDAARDHRPHDRDPGRPHVRTARRAVPTRLLRPRRPRRAPRAVAARRGPGAADLLTPARRPAII